MSTYYCGTSGDMKFATVALHVTKWTFKDNATMVETTNKASSGYYSSVACKRKGEISFEAHWDDALMNNTPSVIAAGESGAFDLALDAADAKSISGTCVISEITYTHDLNGVFSYSGTAETQGFYYLPDEPKSGVPQ